MEALSASGGREALLSLPLLLSSVGLVCSVFGIIMVNLLSGLGPERALELGHQISAVLLIIAAWFLTDYMGISSNVWWAIVAGTVGGILIGVVISY